MRTIPYNSSSLVTEIYTNIPKALRPKPKKEKKKKKGNAERQSSASGGSSTQHAGGGVGTSRRRELVPQPQARRVGDRAEGTGWGHTGQ